MTEYKKPLPKSTPWSTPFWDGCKNKKLLIQQCKGCKKHVFYPKLFCPFCLSQELDWIEASGKGKIYSYTIVHSYQPTEFSQDVPYAVAIIELEEGVRMMSNLVESDLQKVRCDLEVEVVFEDVTDEFTFPKFRLINY